MNKNQSLSLRSLRLGVVAAAALSVLAFAPAANASQPYSGRSLGIDGSANAVEHRLLSHLHADPGADLGVDGSANAVEHRLLSHLHADPGADLGVDGSVNVAEHRLA